MYCKNCGAKIIEGGNFCQNCGTVVEESATQYKSNASSMPKVSIIDTLAEQIKKCRKWFIPGLTLVVVVVVAIIAVMCFRDKTVSDSNIDDSKIISADEAVQLVDDWIDNGHMLGYVCYAEYEGDGVMYDEGPEVYKINLMVSRAAWIPVVVDKATAEIWVDSNGEYELLNDYYKENYGSDADSGEIRHFETNSSGMGADYQCKLVLYPDGEFNLVVNYASAMGTKYGTYERNNNEYTFYVENAYYEGETSQFTMNSMAGTMIYDSTKNMGMILKGTVFYRSDT
jgi:hypothetical protein